MGAHSGERRWLGLWTHTGRHSDSPILETNSDEKVTPFTGRHHRPIADTEPSDGRTAPFPIYTDPVADVQPEHRHRRSRLWGSGALVAAVAAVSLIAVTGSSTGPGTPPNGQAPAVIAPSPDDEPSGDPLDGSEPAPTAPATVTAPGTTVTATPSPQRRTPAGTATITVTPSGPAPAPVRPSGPVPTVTTTRTVTQQPYAPQPTVTVTETRYPPRPRVTVTITVRVPSLLNSAPSSPTPEGTP